MGNQNKAEYFSEADNQNIQVNIEKDPSSQIPSDAEGTFILPSSTNCVKIADLIYSLVRTPIVIYLGGQDFTYNYTPLHMLSSLMEDGSLYLTYSGKVQYKNDMNLIEEYINPISIPVVPNRILFIPLVRGEKLRVQAWSDCTIRQLSLILRRMLKEGEVKIYLNETVIQDDVKIEDLQKFTQIDGLIHLKYSS